MKLAQVFENDVMKTHEKPQSLYPVVVQELRHCIESKFGPEYFMALWSEIAPTGNIYRYNGFVVERRRQCEDLLKQIVEIADECASVLGESRSTNERVELLTKALREAHAYGCPSKQGVSLDVETPTPGFPPLQEFLDENIHRFGPFVTNADPAARNHHLKCVIVAFFVFLIQILAPTLVFMNRWKMKSNYLRDPRKLYLRLTFAEALCFGGTLQEQLTTVMGVSFIFVIVFFVRLYVIEEMHNARKTSRLPTDAFWAFVGILANMCCCIVTVAAIPLLFWSEETPTNIVLDSMTLLFIFKIDDLSELLGGLVGLTDNEFQRIVAWNVALLAQCPVRIRDLIKFDARTVDELWCIKFDSGGNLLTAPRHGCEPAVCETRLVMCPSEASQLLKEEANSGMSQLRYYRSREISIIFPSALNSSLRSAWYILDMVLFVLQFLLPPLWLIVNKPCYL